MLFALYHLIWHVDKEKISDKISARPSIISCLLHVSLSSFFFFQIKIRLLTAHASLKCYTYAFLRRQGDEISDEIIALLPLFSKNSSTLGIYWLALLKDYSYVRFRLYSRKNVSPKFLNFIYILQLKEK